MDDGRLARDALAPRGKRRVKKTTPATLKESKERTSKQIPSSPPIPVPTDNIDGEIDFAMMEQKVGFARNLNPRKSEPALSAYSDVPAQEKKSRRPIVEEKSEQVQDLSTTLNIQKQPWHRSYRDQEPVTKAKSAITPSALTLPYPSHSRSAVNRGKSISKRKDEDNPKVFLSRIEEDTLEKARIYWGGANNEVVNPLLLIDSEGIGYW